MQQLTFIEYFILIEASKIEVLSEMSPPPDDVDVDHKLLFDAENASTGAHVHSISNFLHSYKGAISLLKKTVDHDARIQLWEIVKRNEEKLRSLLTKIRLEKSSDFA